MHNSNQINGVREREQALRRIAEEQYLARCEQERLRRRPDWPLAVVVSIFGFGFGWAVFEWVVRWGGVGAWLARLD